MSLSLSLSLSHVWQSAVAHKGSQAPRSQSVSAKSSASFFFSQEMGLWTIVEGCLLLANALAILNEDRFLAPRGWSFSEFSARQTKSFKGQLVGLIYATQYMRVPLVLLNSICIVLKFVSG